MLSRTMAKTIAIVGAGRVGQSLARALRRRGYRIGAVVARSTRSAHRAVKFIGAGQPLARVEPALLAANVVWWRRRTGRWPKQRARWRD